MSTPASRLITLIMLLQRRPNQKAAELAGELGVSVRTFHRYVQKLEEMGIPLYAERGPQGGYSLVPGYRMPPLLFTREEAVAVYLGAGLVSQMWGELYQDAAQGALAKLDNVLPQAQREEIAWAQRALITTGLHRADYEALAPFLEGWREGIRQGRRLRLLYRSMNRAGPEAREVEPYALVHRAGWWYGIANCRLRQAMRTFRIDRIQQLELLAERFSIPESFDVQAYVERRWSAEPQVHVRMRFLPRFATLAQDNHALWETMEEEADGAIVVTFSVPDLPWAAGTVLSYGGAAVALAPPELCETVREWASYMAQQYAVEQQ